ncbi:ABC transporter substrate-binding protein [Fundidesulfovibrio butyratiphilus]
MRVLLRFAALALLFLPTLALGAEVTGDDGRTLRFDKPFTRVVSLYAAHEENLAAMGAASALVGVCEPGSVRPGVTLVSARDSAEALAALKPDLVLARPMHLAAHPGLVSQLDRLGVAVVCLQPSGPQALENYWLALGRLVGREQAARDMIRTFHADMAHLSALTAAIAPDKRQRVFLESIHRQMKTVSPGSMAAHVLERAGVVNLAADAEPVSGSNIARFGLERLVALGPKVDVYLAQVGPMNPVTREEILATPGFGAVKAVAEGRVALLEEAVVSRPTPRLVEGVRQVIAVCYPELADKAKEAQ